MAYWGTYAGQCDIVAEVFGSPCPNKPATDYQTRIAYSGYGFRSQGYSPNLAYYQTEGEIRYRRRPFDVNWQWDGGGGHRPVIFGWSTGSTGYSHLVKYIDPGNGGKSAWVSHAWMERGGGHTWVSGNWYIYQ